MQLPTQYERLLTAGVSVVAANKVGFAASSVEFDRLREAVHKGGSVYYETTVGAGLPVLRTVSDLAATGDRIIRLQGVLSGTLGYLCDEVMKGHRFSEAVKGAYDLGYTEPDPRDDLSGLDVARKLVILARSAGLDLEPTDVDVEPLLPRDAAAGPIENFWERLPLLDEPMARSRARAAAKGERLVYLGTVESGPESGKARVGLEAVPKEHPCWSLHGSENLILVVSERYHTVPLVVRGPGAGPAVTAAGVFADVLRARAEAQEAAGSARREEAGRGVRRRAHPSSARGRPLKRWRSTRSDAAATLAEALFQGPAPDGGLYVPASRPRVELGAIARASHSFADTALRCALELLGDEVPAETLEQVVEEALDFPVPPRADRRRAPPARAVPRSDGSLQGRGRTLHGRAHGPSRSGAGAPPARAGRDVRRHGWSGRARVRRPPALPGGGALPEGGGERRAAPPLHHPGRQRHRGRTRRLLRRLPGVGQGGLPLGARRSGSVSPRPTRSTSVGWCRNPSTTWMPCDRADGRTRASSRSRPETWAT